MVNREVGDGQTLCEALERDGRKTLIWTREMIILFERSVANAVALSIPDFSKKFVLVTDASDQGVWAMLADREQAGAQLKPIASYHHALTEAERRYGTTEKN